MIKTLNHAQGIVTIVPISEEKKQISITSSQDLFIPIKSCETDYSYELIQLILDIKGIKYLCDEICRDTDPNYVQRDLQYDLSSYFPSEEFSNKRILDFGCGSGASTMILSRMYPNSKIVGIELDQKHLKIATSRLQHYGYKNIEFHLSPSGNELPDNIGMFDVVIMSAVYEHLLPQERENVLPLIWSITNSKGFLFLNMTPHRWFPIERHTTNLPVVNYLPKELALPFARKFSNRIDKSESWEILLRRGIRGATEFEILNILNKTLNNSARLLSPKMHQDRINLWFSGLTQERHLLAKKVVMHLIKLARYLTGQTLVPNLSLVIQKN